ncbi:response regulator transcription factor [Pseudomaricurvus alkylphenolicus]|uniref:response regulator transcription factor n=1 Tax=Pseudomaricurvus alkylphenolicus TaxID=1306991 RepID=UPI00142200E3|nr:response regulator transcription factor [Pseudomaricurvus alkylphenolicus]NIB38581.1 response regulator transcription factor [Pseudomaricurvus alkylphenolicus]
MRIIVADDHPLFRHALTRTIMDMVSTPSRTVTVEEAESVDQVYNLLENDDDCDLVLLDVHFPGANGLSGLANLRGCFPLVPIAMISGSFSSNTVLLAKDLGASGFLSKSEHPDNIASAVRSLLEGEQCFPEMDLAPRDVIDREVGEVAEKVAELTPHQFRVFTLVCEGLLNKQIAYELDISENTVKSHLANIFRKFNVRKRTNLIVLGNLLSIDADDDVDVEVSKS